MRSTHPPFLGFIIAIAMGYASAAIAQTNITQQQADALNHFVELNRQAIEYSQQATDHCSDLVLTKMNAAYQAATNNEFVKQYLVSNHHQNVPMNLALHQAVCHTSQGDYQKAVTLLNNAVHQVPPHQLSPLNQQYYTLTLAQGYVGLKQWQPVVTLLQPIINSPDFKTWEPELITTTLQQLSGSLIALRQFGQAVSVQQQLISHLKTNQPERLSKIQEVEELLATISQMAASKPGGHYYNMAAPDRRRWHDQTHTVYIWLDTQKAPEYWTPTRTQRIKDALAQWQQAMQEIKPGFLFKYVESEQPYDIRVGLVNKLPLKTAHSERLGWNRIEIQNNLVLSDDVEFALFEADKTPVSDERLYRVALHEFGHMMGLDHSTHIDDVMAISWLTQFDIDLAPALTDRDKRSLAVAYQTPSPATNSPYGTLSQMKTLLNATLDISALSQQGNVKDVQQQLDNLLQQWPNSMDLHYLKLGNYHWNDYDKQALASLEQWENNETNSGPFLYYFPQWLHPADVALLHSDVWRYGANTAGKSKLEKIYRQRAIGVIEHALNEEGLTAETRTKLTKALEATRHKPSGDDRGYWGWEKKPTPTIIIRHR